MRAEDERSAQAQSFARQRVANMLEREEKEAAAMAAESKWEHDRFVADYGRRPVKVSRNT